MAEIYQKFMKDVEEFLEQPGKISTYMNILEKTTGVKKIYIAQGGMGVFFFYMVFGYFAQLVCNFVGFVYPAYASLKALESDSKEDDVRWLTYWVVFALFNVIEFFSDVIFSWFPFYWLAKVIFLIWCYLPIENNGTNYVYHKILRPFFLRNTSNIDNVTKRIIKEAKDAVTKDD